MSNTWTSDLPKVLFLHAYSPRNSGDGLLVDLARDAVVASLGPADIKVIASDADAFGGSEFEQWEAPLISRTPFISRRLSMLATGMVGPTQRIRQLMEEADLIVAVGGGYLRGGALGPAVKSWGAHYGQLRLAARHGQKTVYLPQSIGPFSGTYKRAIGKALSNIHTVYVRDDRSVSEFASVGSLKRMPDLAVLELANTPPALGKQENLAGNPIFVARELSNPRGYYNLLDEASKSDQFEWALQSTGGGNNDYPLTRRLSSREPQPLRNILSGPESRIVVSTRLHGALSSLIAGFPAIHLSYERKGWGAFEDLGLDEFVLNARDASLAQVNDLIQKIRSNPSKYWTTIDNHRSRILAQHRLMISRVRDIADLKNASSS